MTITGHVKFFNQSSSLFSSGASIVVTSGSDTARFILGTNKYLEWKSVGSDDVTTETITITLPIASTIDRIFLIGMNFKDFDVRYDNGSGFTDFTNVVGLDGALGGGIIETTYARDTAYYEFDSVAGVTDIQIRANTTQVVDAQKFLRTFYSIVEIGTLEGFPNVKNKFDRNANVQKSLSGKFAIIKSFDVVDSIDLKFKVNIFQEDQDIVECLYDLDDPFLIWLCGGFFGFDDDIDDCDRAPTAFKIDNKGWRLEDVFQVQMDGTLNTNFFPNLYKAGTSFSLKMKESIN